MPPFLGQGMCSGFRDAHNLAWKLDLILTGEHGTELLDSYAAERSPHVRAITKRAVELGRVQTIRDEKAAKMRDDELLRRKRKGNDPRIQVPRISAGYPGDRLPEDRARGQLFPQGWVTAVRRSGSGSTTSSAGAGYCSFVTRPC